MLVDNNFILPFKSSICGPFIHWYYVRSFHYTYFDISVSDRSNIDFVVEESSSSFFTHLISRYDHFDAMSYAKSWTVDSPIPFGYFGSVCSIHWMYIYPQFDFQSIYKFTVFFWNYFYLNVSNSDIFAIQPIMLASGKLFESFESYPLSSV